MPAKKTTKKTAPKAVKTVGASKKAAKKAVAKKPVAKKSEGLFAVIETGGKQYVVAEGKTIQIEKLKDSGTGKKVTFEKVLLVDDGKTTQIGDPYLKGAKVEGKLEAEGKNKKIDVVRFKSKSRYHKRRGHRQPYARVTISAIK